MSPTPICQPPPGEVHVWSADVDAVLALEAIHNLDGHETERVRRFIRPTDGRRFAAGRACLRTLLSGYLGSDPITVQFGRSAQNSGFQPPN